MKLVLVFLAMLLSLKVSTAAPSNSWRWYYATYGSPATDAKLFVRAGTAAVVIDGGTIRIELTEATPVADSKSFFVGKIDGTKVSGRLTKFFPSGDEVRVGEYKQMQIANCIWRQFNINPAQPDGSALVISSMEGVCQ